MSWMEAVYLYVSYLFPYQFDSESPTLVQNEHWLDSSLVATRVFQAQYLPPSVSVSV